MKTRRTRKALAIGMFAAFCSVFGTGCSLEGFMKNAWFGFGSSFGAIPANLIADYIFGNFFGLGDDAAQ